jgi:putative glycosyltransferase (TIGR04348 family)
MAQITIVSPTGAGTRTGNLHTAQRYARFLRSAGHRVSVATGWDGRACDLMIALHAKRSHESVVQFKKQRQEKPLVVVLTGTDLYRDLPASAEARESLRLADRVIVLQEDALRVVDKAFRPKIRVVYQSSAAAAAHSPPGDRFRVAVVGHLRDEKDPFRAVSAFALLDDANLELVQLGAPLAPGMEQTARHWMARDARYRWLGSVPHSRTLGWIARSHLLVVSSIMEGGANVICEAARIGTPVLASRVSGNIGMLGRDYPGYFDLHDEQGLAGLIEKYSSKKQYEKLRRYLAARRGLFAPAAEKRALLKQLVDLGARRRG